jgi:putative lipoprotein
MGYLVRRLLCALLLCGWSMATPAGDLPLNEAAQPDLEFRAFGFEPRWLFDLDSRGGIRFTVENGAPFILPARGPILDSGRSGIVYGTRTETNEMLAEIVESSCLDATSGKRLTHTVTIRLNGREYRGCGAALKS